MSQTENGEEEPLEMWSNTSFYSWENWGQKAHWIPGIALRTADCITVTLMKWLCLFRRLSCFLLSTKHFSEFFLPQTEQAQLGTNVSLIALARPSPPYDPEKGKLLGPIGCYGLQFPNKLCKNTPLMTKSTLSLLLLITDIKPFWV